MFQPFLKQKNDMFLHNMILTVFIWTYGFRRSETTSQQRSHAKQNNNWGPFLLQEFPCQNQLCHCLWCKASLGVFLPVGGGGGVRQDYFTFSRFQQIKVSCYHLIQLDLFTESPADVLQKLHKFQYGRYSIVFWQDILSSEIQLL